MTCNKDLQAQNKPYPRTCAECGLGPCHRDKTEVAPVIWVLIPDYGTEGLQEPFMAFRNEDVARDAKTLIEKNPSSMTMRLVPVPIWRHDR